MSMAGRLTFASSLHGITPSRSWSGQSPLSAECLSGGQFRRRSPELDFGGVELPDHLTNAILDRFPAAQSQSSIALDLGCGTGPHRAVCERAGFQWVGLDCAERVPIWEDGHALPFADDSFEFVFTIAVLEHIRYPFVVLQEVNGVRKPGGTLIGTVAFLEPFHAQSFYHHCDLGTLNLLAHSGLSALEVAPHADWTARTAHARVGLFPRMSPKLSRLVILPTDALIACSGSWEELWIRERRRRCGSVLWRVRLPSSCQAGGNRRCPRGIARFKLSLHSRRRARMRS